MSLFIKTFLSARIAALLILIAGAQPAAFAEADTWAMRWRVFCDNSAGISFRYPYDYYVPDQYKPEMVRGRGGDDASSGTIKEVEINGKKMKLLITNEEPRSGPDVRAFSVLASQLPAEVAGGDLAAIGSNLAGTQLAWTAFDYYQKSDARPQGNPTWAPKDIKAMVGEGKNACGLVVKYGERYAGMVLSGPLAKGDNQAIINTFEVEAGGGKSKQPFQTWREGQTKLGKALDATGKPLAASKGKPAAWAQGWDLETAHYHITTQVSPARLVQYGIYLEALYKAYSSIYEPDSVPPYKLEIHIFNTQQDFMEASAAHGFPVGQTVGGFFVPSLLSIFAYEESSKWGGESFSVEHVLAHECSHQFLHVTCNGSSNVPTWINEGLAVYFESGVFVNGAFNVLPPRDRIERLKNVYQQINRTIRPLDQYLGHYDHISPDEYGEVYAMTNFWIFGSCENGDAAHCKHKICGLAHFREYWKALKRHEDGTKAFEETFMKDMIKAQGSREAAVAAWEKAYFDYVKRILR